LINVMLQEEQGQVSNGSMLLLALGVTRKVGDEYR